MKTNGKKHIERLLDELEARQRDYDIGPPEDCDIAPTSQADQRMEQRRLLRKRASAKQVKKSAITPRVPRWLIQSVIQKQLELARDASASSGLPGSCEFVEEIEDLLRSKFLY